MIIYESKTGYVRNIKTGECFHADKIYVGKNSSLSDFEDITQAEYEAWEEEQRKKYEPLEGE